MMHPFPAGAPQWVPSFEKAADKYIEIKNWQEIFQVLLTVL